MNGTGLPWRSEWPWVGSSFVPTYRLVAQEVNDVGVAVGSSQVKRSALVVVAGVWGHAIVDEQLHVGCITIHTRLEEGPCSIHHAQSHFFRCGFEMGFESALVYWNTSLAMRWNGHCAGNTCHDCGRRCCLFICLSIYLVLCLSIKLANQHASMHASNNSVMHPSVHESMHASIQDGARL